MVVLYLRYSDKIASISFSKSWNSFSDAKFSPMISEDSSFQWQNMGSIFSGVNEGEFICVLTTTSWDSTETATILYMKDPTSFSSGPILYISTLEIPLSAGFHAFASLSK